MVSDNIWLEISSRLPKVLTLVLMEYGLWLLLILTLFPTLVLILVLMEYGLWHYKFMLNELKSIVLILVLMEYGLWQIRQTIRRHLRRRS